MKIEDNRHPTLAYLKKMIKNVESNCKIDNKILTILLKVINDKKNVGKLSVRVKKQLSRTKLN